jgi:hypothetical protein
MLGASRGAFVDDSICSMTSIEGNGVEKVGWGTAGSSIVRAATVLILVVGLSGASCAQPVDTSPPARAVHRLCTRMIMHAGYVVVPCKPTVLDSIVERILDGGLRSGQPVGHLP